MNNEGVKKVVETNEHGENIVSYETTGEEWKYYFSWYCLKKFNTYEERVAHDNKYHNIDEFMVGCVPSGFPVNYKSSCGDENTIE